MKYPISSTSPHRRKAFTLIELLIVISIMVILASMVIPITGVLKKKKVLLRARTELREVETSIMAYKQKLGHYPPDNRAKPYQNQLYYELEGTQLDTAGNYKTLDGIATINSSVLNGIFGTSGFVNSSKGGGGEEAQSGQSFFRAKQGRAAEVTSPPSTQPYVALGSLLDGPITLPTTAVGSSLATKLNPWSYISTGPTNNPTSFDLWMDVYVGKTIYRICNWSQEPLKL